jgi:hypothetical protein
MYQGMAGEISPNFTPEYTGTFTMNDIDLIITCLICGVKKRI